MRRGLLSRCKFPGGRGSPNDLDIGWSWIRLVNGISASTPLSCGILSLEESLSSRSILYINYLMFLSLISSMSKHSSLETVLSCMLLVFGRDRLYIRCLGTPGIFVSLLVPDLHARCVGESGYSFLLALVDYGDSGWVLIDMVDCSFLFSEY